MYRKFKGFSLAELMVSLLIVSIVLSAAIPTITRKNAQRSNETIWNWTKTNGAYFGLSENQNAILGYNTVPNKNDNLSTLISLNQSASDYQDQPGYVRESNFDPLKRSELGEMNALNIDDKFDNASDKFIILKRNSISTNSNFVTSHIGFYTLENTAASSDDLRYVGRLAMDYGNMAMGIASLQGINHNNLGENTALGHFTLSKNIDGIRNTAVGRKSLSSNLDGSYNTALGFGSLFQLGGLTNMNSTTQNTPGGYKPDENTAIGAMSQSNLQSGRQNTSIGAQSLKRNTIGIGNTAVGRLSLYGLVEGDNNIAIGHRSCQSMQYGNNNICIGGFAGTNEIASATQTSPINNTLFIGTSEEIPLIAGSTKHVGTQDKKFIVNSKLVEFRPYNGATPLFQFVSSAGTWGSSIYDKNYGYSTTPNGYYGHAMFLLRDFGNKPFYETGATSNIDAASTALSLSARRNGADKANKAVYIDAADPYNRTSQYKYSDISFNQMLTFDFEPYKKFDGTSYVDAFGKVRIASQNPETGLMYPLILNNSLELNANNASFNVYHSGNLKNFDIGGDKLRTNIDLMYNTSNQIFIGLGTKNNSNAACSYDNPGPCEFDIYLTNDNGGSEHVADMYLQGLKDTSVSGTDAWAFGGSVINAIRYARGFVYEYNQHSSSDARLKNIIGNNTAGLKEINALEVKNYTYKRDEKKVPHVGVIAQQLQKIFPDAVTKDAEGYLKIRTEDIFYAMVNSIKELFAQIQDLTAKITGLDKRISELEKQNQLLTKQNKEFEKRLEKLEKQTAKK